MFNSKLAASVRYAADTLATAIRSRTNNAVQLDRIESKLDQLSRLVTSTGENLMAHFTAIENAVTQLTDVVSSAETLLSKLSDEIRQISDPAGAQALADRIDAERSRLAAAVQANTPADPNA